MTQEEANRLRLGSKVILIDAPESIKHLQNKILTVSQLFHRGDNIVELNIKEEGDKAYTNSGWYVSRFKLAGTNYKSSRGNVPK